MKRLTLIIALFITGSVQALDCSPDSSYHIDNRIDLPVPDGGTIPNPNYGQLIATGLCGCIGFGTGLSVVPEDSSITLTVKMVDNEPIRGLQMDIYHDAGLDLIFEEEEVGSLQKGEKLEIVFDANGDTNTSVNAMHALAGDFDDYVKVLVYSSQSARTAGDSTEGVIFTLTYKAANGHNGLPETIAFYLDQVHLIGSSVTDFLNVSCSYPDQDNAVTFNTDLGINDEIIANVFNLHQNYPNPFNPTTKISFDLYEQGFVKLIVYNILGQQVNVLANSHMNAGLHILDWNGLDANGYSVSSGVYFYQLQADGFTARKKMLLLR